MTSDGLGLPVRIIATAGNRNDITHAQALLDGLNAHYVIADKGYDGQSALQAVRAAGTVPVIRRRKTTANWRPFDRDLYKARHLIECLSGKLKQFRRIRCPADVC